MNVNEQRADIVIVASCNVDLIRYLTIFEFDFFFLNPLKNVQTKLINVFSPIKVEKKLNSLAWDFRLKASFFK